MLVRALLLAFTVTFIAPLIPASAKRTAYASAVATDPPLPSPSSSSQRPVRSAATFASASEGSLRSIAVSSTLGSKPGGSDVGFFNPKRRVGRDLVVLSVAEWLVEETARNGGGNDYVSQRRSSPVTLLDATCAAGAQGLRIAVESTALARSYISGEQTGTSGGCSDDEWRGKGDPPELDVILNDADEAAADLAEKNAATVLSDMEAVLMAASGGEERTDLPRIDVTRRYAQAALHESPHDVTVLDPFGSTAPFLDAAFARAPHRGLVEICATDVGALFGSRPAVTRRHYGSGACSGVGTTASAGRPPCYRERGVRLLLAEAAKAAARHDKGILPTWAVSTEHYVLASVRTVRGARRADEAMRWVRNVRICQACGAAWAANGPTCSCTRSPGTGADAEQEWTLWTGPIYDDTVVRTMVSMANSIKSGGTISKQTYALLSKIRGESAIGGSVLFHRRPGVASGNKTPRLDDVISELERRGHTAARTHFDSKALRSNATPQEFDLAVIAAVARN